MYQGSTAALSGPIAILMAKAKVAAGKAAATGQPTLNVRERQVIGALTGYDDKINTTNPGLAQMYSASRIKRKIRVWETLFC